LANYYVMKIDSKNNTDFIVKKNGEKIGEFTIERNGDHNLYNALIAIAVCYEYGINLKIIATEILNFKGVKRRYQKIGKINEAQVISDYAHHPVELEKIITETKSKLNGKVFVVFQPHTFSRTKYFWSDFIKALSLADNIVMYPIYSAREKAVRGVTSKRMSEDLRRMGKICYYASKFDEVRNYLKYFVKKDDIVLILGAGDIGAISHF